MYKHVHICVYVYVLHPQTYSQCLPRLLGKSIILRHTKEEQLLLHKRPGAFAGTGTLTFLNSRAESEIDEHKVGYIHGSLFELDLCGNNLFCFIWYRVQILSLFCVVSMFKE